MYTRRTALTALGLGTAALLAACSSKSSSESSATASASATESSTASATPSVSPTAEATTTIEPGPSMKGEVVLADYSSTGTFEPGTKEHKAVNVAIPVEPAKLRENSVEGLHAFIAYWQATLNYLLLTGDASIDENARMTSALVAGHLGWPCLQEVQAVEKTDSGWTVTQSVPGGTRSVAVDGPAVIAVTADAAKTRVPGMKDILAAGKKKVAVVKVEAPPVPVELVERTRPETRSRKNKIVADADELVAVLRTDGVL